MEAARAERELQPAADIHACARERVLTFLDLPLAHAVYARASVHAARMRRRSSPLSLLRPCEHRGSLRGASLSSYPPPIPSTPLTNCGAYMSVAHIVTPSLIPAHRALSPVAIHAWSPFKRRWADANTMPQGSRLLCVSGCLSWSARFLVSARQRHDHWSVLKCTGTKLLLTHPSTLPLSYISISFSIDACSTILSRVAGT